MNNSKGLKIALIVSLSLNLLVAGVFIGRSMDRVGHGNIPMRWAMEEVDGETREKLATSMRKQFRDTKALRHALRSAQRTVEEQVSADPFDAEATASAFGTLRQAAAELQQAMHSHLIRNLAELTPEERVAVFRVFSHRGRPQHGASRDGPHPVRPGDLPP